MTERSYTIREIDQMRDNVYRLMQSFSGTRRGYSLSAPNATAVEERLRTYMIAGIHPADLALEASEDYQRKYLALGES